MKFFPKTLINFIPVSIFMSLTTGCATVKNPEAPITENFPHSFQKQLQASNHWEIIANDLASQIQESIVNKKITARPIYLNLQSNQTDFTRAFNDFLITSLVKKGVAVSKLKSGSTIYEYKVQTVQYKSNRSTFLPNKAKWTTLAAGLVVFRNVAHVINTADTAILGAGVLADVWTADGAPKLELIITSSILNDNLYLTRTTDIYYANEIDIHLYEGNSSSKKSKAFDDPFYQLN